MALFDFDSSLPLASPEVKLGMRIAVLAVPYIRLKVGFSHHGRLVVAASPRTFTKNSLIGRGMTNSAVLEKLHPNGRHA
jgi:DUF917 family protein